MLLSLLKPIIMVKLSKRHQVIVLQSIDLEDMVIRKYGLCYAIRMSLLKEFGIDRPVDNLDSLFPLFIIDNAIVYGAKHSDMYWWERNNYGYMQRIIFVDWMIRTLSHQLWRNKKNNDVNE